MNESTNTPASSEASVEMSQAAHEAVHESAPVNTSSDQMTRVEAPKTETENQTDTQTNTENQTDTPETDTDTNTETPTTETNTEDSTDGDYLTPEQIQALREQTQYQPEDQEVDLVDEYGYIDPKKLQSFMVENNQRVFEQAVKAVEAKAQAERIETQSWEKIHQSYPELKESPGLEQALRGARIADLAAGGDGNIHRIAQEFMKPIRDSKVQAVEETNRSISKQEALSTHVQESAAPERPAPSLMSRLRTALENGDQAQAQEIRNAIRMERIRDTTKM